MEEIIDIITNYSTDKQLGLEKCLDVILPKKEDGSIYSFDEIDVNLHRLRDEITSIRSENNDLFDEILNDDETKTKLKNLYENLHNVQLQVMKLQCDIAFTKEQYNTVVNTCDNTKVQNYRDILNKEKEVKKNRKQLRYKSVVDFFDLFSSYLSTAELNFRSYLISHRSTVNYKQQMFDWSKYHQLLYLIRACGKAIIDSDRVERLYQSQADIKEIFFQQPVNQLDFNNFVEFFDTYSLETQIDLSLARYNHKLSLKDYLKLPDISDIIKSTELINYQILNDSLKKLMSLNVSFTQSMIEINMDYIEAHLTDGINIDKLNGGENATISPLEEQQTLPQYAFSPQEYITQIGQHILTLRKQTEPYDTVENGYLKFGLETAIKEIPSLNTLHINICCSITEIIMRSIARLCVQSLLGRTSQSILSKLTSNGKRQLSTDVLYLDNVLEDLKLLDTEDPNFTKFKSLLT